MAPWSRAKPADPIFDRLSHAQAELAIAQIERELDMIAPVTESRVIARGMPAGGETQASPFVEDQPKSRSLLPWRRNVVEAREIGPPTTRAVQRAGFIEGIPQGGTTATNPGFSSTPGAPDRDTEMDELLQAYLVCPWVSVSVDTIARTITAGALTLAPVHTEPEDEDEPVAPPEVDRVQSLLDYVNPSDDIRQLMRRVYTDMLIFGDSFTEVSWLAGEPVALWPLDCQTMSVIADEHGTVTGYIQMTTTGRQVSFEPEQIIHVKMDSPGAGLYGVSPTQKCVVAIKTWLFAAGLLKETMKKGDPPRVHIDWPIQLSQPEMRKASQQYSIRNLGTQNVGLPFETKGGAQVKELSANKIDFWIAVMNQARDEILSEFGVPGRKAGVAEPGSLGGTGAEAGQDRTFLVNTCGPTEELALEKFTFALCYQAFGIKDWRIKFAEVDWRDELIVEQIRDLRLRNGAWSLDRYRKDINEPTTVGGDKPVLVARQIVTLWQDLEDLSKAMADKQSQPTTPFGLPALPPDDDNAPPPKVGSQESLDIGLSETWRREWDARRRSVLRELGE